jgi:MucR family transcriptional regulator, transcriptional regulator of exopolysaccharide biosynthesis
MRASAMSTEEITPHLTATIVGSYVRHHTVGANQLSDLITKVHHALGQLGQPIPAEEVLTPAVSVRRSVHHDYVVCLDCGYRGKTLRRHISTRHGLSRDEYLRRWGLKSDHPLTAPAYSARRSSMARALGLGRQPSRQAAPVETAAVATARVEADQKLAGTPKPRRRARLAAKPADSARSEVVAAPSPARRGRPRSRAGVVSQPKRAASPTAES